MNRAKWLQDKIEELSNKELFAELDEVDKIFLGGYRDELKLIKEQGLWQYGVMSSGEVGMASYTPFRIRKVE